MKMAVPIACAPEPLDVVLIDEPELHLHSSIQTHLMAALRRLSPTTQFIVATNSEAILQMALSYERFLILNDREVYEPSARQI
jgi:predicted ATP-dependent endonuclease of OLD family